MKILVLFMFSRDAISKLKDHRPDPDEEWNLMSQYYPGSDYVDWLGLRAYGQQYPDQGWIKLETPFPKFYGMLISVDNTNPVILAEWGVGEFPKDGYKASYKREAMGRFSKEYPNLKAAIYWHER